MERSEVYHRIDQEREYQIQRWEDGRRVGDKSDSEKDLGTWIIYIEDQLNKAKSELYHLREEEAKARLRKIAALAVAAMEVHGCPERKNFFEKITEKIVHLNL
jgi:hypothetical protein